MSLWDDAEALARKKGGESTPDADDQDFDALGNDNLDDEDIEEEAEAIEEGEEEEVEEEEEEKETPPDETGLTPEEQMKAKDQILKLMGEDTVLKIRGVEKKASELSPKEFVAFLQKGMDSDQLYQKVAADRRALDVDRAKLENEILAISKGRQEGVGTGPLTGLPADVAQGLGLVTTLPDYLKPAEDDTKETLAWKESQVKLLDEHNAMKVYLWQKARQEQDTAKVNEVLALRDNYPMASIDEVLAVKTVRPDEPAENLMRASHNYYTGADFLKKALESSPTFKREYDAEVIKGYLAKKGSAAKLPGKKARGAGVERVSLGSNKRFRGTFEDAERLALQYADQIDKMEKGG